MNKEQILNLIKKLACSQGMYGRLLNRMNEDSEFKNKFLNAAEAQHFGDAVDFVMWYEC